jgi:hypothetical protein
MNYRLLKYELMLLIIFSLLLSFASCNTTEPDTKPPVEPDSTTQNFTFETFEFGDGFESSWLNDVWIFDENNIWAVGYLAPSDTTVNGIHITNPNIIKWDGTSWKLQPFSGTSNGIEGIWALDSSHIYFASGGLRKYVNGVYSTINTNLGLQNYQGIYKLWGNSENNIWGVGPGGTIVRYDGIAWSKIEFDEGWRFDAITGSKQMGIAYASATSQQFNTIIVELKNNSATVIYNSANDPNNLSSFNLELLDENTLLLGRTKLWSFDILSKNTKIISTLTSGYSAINIAINSPIDVYYFVDKYGSGLELMHFNGKRFKELTFSNVSNQIKGDAFAIKDLAVMTGFSNNKGYLVKVKRIK